MKKLILTICCLLCIATLYAQTTTTISSGTNIVNTGATINIPAGFFVNDGSYTDTTSPGVMNINGGVTFSGSGTTTVYNLNFNSGSSVLNSAVTVYGAATVAAGATLNSNGNVIVNPGGTLVVDGVITNNSVQGLVSYASPSTGACPLYTSTLTTNVSGAVILYQWQVSPDSITWTSIPGATNASYTASVTVGGNYYSTVITTTNTTYNETTAGVQLQLTGTPAVPAGPTAVCVASSITLSDATSFGAWSSSNTSVVTIVSGSGVATGVAAGTATITYSLVSGCNMTRGLTVNPLPASIAGTFNTCPGLTTTLSDATPSGTWSSNNTALATVGSASGIVTGVASGIPNISYTLTTTGCFSSQAVTVNPLPASITGTPSVCAGLTTQLTDANSGGAWSSSNTATATVGSSNGLVSGVAAGTSSITYTLPTGCYIWQVVTVNPLPAAITGTFSVCATATTALADVTPFGNWSSSATSIATIGSASGVATGIAAGTATMTYTLSTGCIITASVTVSPSPLSITGTTNVCVAAQTSLNDASGFGVWSSDNTAVASVGSGTGFVTGVTPGVATISYSFATGCFASTPVTVNPAPAAITGIVFACIGGSSTLSDATSGGAWSSSNTTVAGVGSSSGIVTGASVGTATISYTALTGCFSTAAFSINPFPASITGTASVCISATTNLADATPFGSWSSSNTSVATVGSGTGIVSGVAAGTATVTYTASTGCTSTVAVTVNPLPTPITGVTNACPGTTAALFDVPSPGGTWTSGNTTVATINAGTGVATGIVDGTSTVTYTLSTGCFVTQAITINPLPAAIAGTMSACVGLSSTLSDATPLGNWSSSITTVATVGSGSGIVTASIAGTTTITYTLPTGCISTGLFTVNPLPASISGTTNVCLGGTTSLSDVTPFGSWSSSNSSFVNIASGSGLASGVTVGTATITYALATGCIATAPVTVNPLPSSITGTTNVCAGLTTALTDAGGGTWISSNTTAATVSGSGVVSGLAAGTTTITYTLPTGCVTTSVITVNPLPSAITGTTNECIGGTTALGDPTPLGAWSSSNTSVATIDAATGISTGVTAGTTTITYTLGTGCIITTPLTVNPFPSAITGTTNVCIGNTTALTDAGGGAWSSSNTSVATVAGTGVVTGVSAGTLTVTYTLGTGCIATTAVTVNPFPSAIAGTMNACAGLTSALSDASPLGAWTSSTTTVAIVISGTGVVSGVTAGTTTVTYTLPTGCISTGVFTVNPLPASISGTTNVCIGNTTGLSDATAFGSWSSSNIPVAQIGSGSGIVTGMTAGTVTITYTLATGCISTTPLTVNPFPAAISGTMNVCAGLTTGLSDVSPLGTWASSNTTVATISGSGVVSGLVAGTTTITYTLPTGCLSTTAVTVNPLPSAITGTTNECIGATTSLADPTPFGAWSSSNTSVATIGAATGISTGVTAGTTTITYTLGTGCIITTPLTVNPFPSAITGTTNVCIGNTTALTDAGGGAWSSSNTTVATVAGTGVVTGVSAGTLTVTYTLGTGCIATTAVTVNPFPTAIAGTMNACAGLTSALSDASPLGAWTSSTTTVATVISGTGVVSGVTAGTTTITYTLPTGCISTGVFTVNPLPAAISGTTNVCIGNTTGLSDATAFGVWSSSNIPVAQIGSGSGIVTGMTAGTVTVTYSLATGCISTTPLTVNPFPAAISGTMNVCAGLTTGLSDASPLGTWASSNTTVATVSGSGVVSGLVAGTTTITYTLPTGCVSIAAVIVNPLPSAITGTTNECIGATTSLADPTPFGVWSSSNTSVATIGAATGISTGVTAGTTTITYTLGTGCIITTPLTVNPFPSAITGTTNVCIGNTTALTDAGGGTWSSSNTTVATVAGTGVVTGVSAGTLTVTYTLGTGCIATTAVTVNPFPSAIAGTMNACVGLTSALSDASPLGAWTSSTTTVATVISGSGVVSGVTAGTTTITYTLPTGCISTGLFTVNPLPAAISGTTNVCIGNTTTLSNSTGFGAWSSSNIPVAQVGSGTGIVSGMTTGTVTITYTLATGCISTTPLTVNPFPAAISGTMNVCAGLTTGLSDASPLGTWASSNTTVATVSGSGVVSGLVAGTTTITYTLPTGCVSIAAVTVNPLPLAITGTTNECIGATTPLADPTPFGVWSSSNTSVATIGAATGISTGVTAGTTTITYTLGTGCIITAPLTVNPFPSAITGTTNVCIGNTTALTDAGGGTWSSSNTTVATVAGTGMVTGVSAGTLTVTYTLGTGCIATTAVTVNPFPAAIAGTLNACVGLTSSLGDASPLGTWSSSNTSVATISVAGLVSGVTAGTTTITYTLPTGCISTGVFTVNPLPATINGTTNVCIGNTTGLSDATAFGVWSSSNIPVAQIGSGSGIVTGMTAGTVTITYSLATGCISTTPLTVNPFPAAISGTMNVCAGLTTGLSDVSPLGTWASSNTTVATVSGSGVVSGLVAGTTTITYTLPTGCVSTVAVTVNPLPLAITGTTNECIGATTSLADPTPFGVWSSSNTSVATISAATGVSTGVTAGTTTITYTLGTGCIITAPLTVNPFPSAITGTTNVCIGNTTALTDAGGGSWSSSNTTVGGIDLVTGIITGVSAGTLTATYTLATGCIATTAVTVNPFPAAIAGTMNVCVGLTSTLNNTSPLGVWSISNTSVATIGASSGVVSGLVAGTATVTYTLPTGCIMTGLFTVNPLPAAIGGVTNVCPGNTTGLSDATAFGMWSSSNIPLAQVGSGTGIVTGMMAGTVTITYSLATGCISTTPLTVNPLPAAITGTTSICPGIGTTLSNASPGGTWSSSNTLVVISSPGTSSSTIVTGVVAGTATITYKLPTGCIMTTPFTVIPLPAPITGNTNVCLGSTTVLGDPTPFGMWTSSNTTLATVGSAAGLVTGLAVGTLTMTYSLSTGCKTTTSFTVNPLPSAISGSSVVCRGSTITLSDAGGGTWASGNIAIAMVGSSSGIVAGITAGTVQITYTLPTGCIATKVLTVNPFPAVISGPASVCVGSTITLTDSVSGGIWSNSGYGIANTVGTATGIVTGVATGTTTITYTIPTGCNITTVVTINPLPAAIAGITNVCSGLATTLTDATNGGVWSSSNTSIATVGTAGTVTAVIAGTLTVSYTLPTGCYAAAGIVVNPLPTAIMGTMSVCSGSTVTLSNASAGGMWSSSNSTVVTAGSSSGIVTGASAGTATVTYTLGTGCIATAMVTVNALPNVYTVTGGGGYCTADTGRHVFLSGSESGINYQLYDGAATAGTGVLLGSGSGLDFGLFTAAGTYTVVATNPATTCKSNMLSSAVISIIGLPATHIVNGGGSYCAGGTGVHVGLGASSMGVKYQLYVGGVPTGTQMAGTGGAVDFGLQTTTGTYTVYGTDTTTTCVNKMTDSVTVSTTTPDTAAVSIYYGPLSDTLCGGKYVTFTAIPVHGGSTPKYSWKVNGIGVDTGNVYTFKPVNGDVVSLKMTSNASCIATDTAVSSIIVPIIVSSMPTVTISSDHGDTVCGHTLVTYTASITFGGGAPQLAWVKNGLVVDSGYTYRAVPVTGDIIYSTLLSNYRCRDTNLAYSNDIYMVADSAIVPKLDIFVTPGTSIAKGTVDTFTAYVIDGGLAPFYQWSVNKLPIAGATTAVFSGSNFADNDSVSCRVTRNDACGLSTFNTVRLHVTTTGVVQVGNAASNIGVIPNPNSGEFIVKGSLGTTDDMPVTFELTNMLGQVVYSDKTIAKNGTLEQRIHVSKTLANGMYLLNVHSETISKVFHVVIEQ